MNQCRAGRNAHESTERQNTLKFKRISKMAIIAGKYIFKCEIRPNADIPIHTIYF